MQLNYEDLLKRLISFYYYLAVKLRYIMRPGLLICSNDLPDCSISFIYLFKSLSVLSKMGLEVFLGLKDVECSCECLLKIVFLPENKIKNMTSDELNKIVSRGEDLHHEFKKAEKKIP